MSSQQPAAACLSTADVPSVDEEGPTKSALLGLIPEMRDLIFETVLISPLSPPRFPTDKTHRKLLSIFVDISSDRQLEQTTFYPIQPIPNPAKGLFNTCRQTRNEIRDLIIHARSGYIGNSKHELSITILSERTLYPTWLLVPVRPLSVANLVWTDIHIAGSFTRHGSRYHSGWCASDNRVPSIIWGLFNILNQFLLHGPSFTGHRRYKVNDEKLPDWEDRHPAYYEKYPCKGMLRSRPILELKLLVLNVVTPTEAEMEGKSFFPENCADNPKDPIEGVIRPESVVQHLKEHITRVVGREKYAVRWSYLLYERLKRIILCLDGKECYSWDLFQAMKRSKKDDLEGDDSSEDSGDSEGGDESADKMDWDDAEPVDDAESENRRAILMDKMYLKDSGSEYDTDSEVETDEEWQYRKSKLSQEIRLSSEMDCENEAELMDEAKSQNHAESDNEADPENETQWEGFENEMECEYEAWPMEESESTNEPELENELEWEGSEDEMEPGNEAESENETEWKGFE